MKQTLTILSFIMLTFFACKKDSGSSPTANNPTGTNPTGTNPTSGGITITSVSPTNFYADDALTITGTGFNPDKTKDTVYFGSIYDSNGTKKFSANSDGSKPNAGFTNIISASATQLVVKVVDSSEMDYDAFYNPDDNKYPQGVQVNANGKSTFVPIKLLPLVQLHGISDPQKPIQTVYYAYPGDTIQMLCLGPVDKSSSITIGSKQLTYSLTTQTPYAFFPEATATIFIPPAFFGGSNIDTATITTPVTVTIPGGRSFTSKFTFWTSPRMTIQSIKSLQPSYSLATNGGEVILHVKGHCLKSDSYVSITGQNGHINLQQPLGVSGFPDETDIKIGTGGLSTGTYGVVVQRKTYDGKVTNYGIGSFTLIP